MKSVHQNISYQIERLPSGSILFPRLFRGRGTDTAIKMSLSRLAAKSTITRICHGIYIKPSKGKKEKSKISLENFANAIAKNEGLKIKPAGSFAAHKLGLSDTYPKDLTYVTDGEPKRIKIGPSKIVFKSTTPRKFRMKGKVSSLLIQYLEDVGQKNVDEAMKKKIVELLGKENEKDFLSDINLAAAWIYELLLKLNNVIHDNR